jgi:adenine-specific DNA-methyltransferase
MNSLIEKEGMSGKLQMIYIDPPYGIRYGSNFQPFVDKTNVNDKKDEDLTQEPEMIRAFRDTWELGIHSYLSYLRDRLLLAKELLSESGSVFVQISDENIHHVREICDEIFGKENFVIMISYASTSGFPTNTISRAGDYVVWYAKSIKNLKIRPLFVPKIFGGDGSTLYKKIELADGKRMSISEWEKENGVNFDYDNVQRAPKFTVWTTLQARVLEQQVNLSSIVEKHITPKKATTGKQITQKGCNV